MICLEATDGDTLVIHAIAKRAASLLDIDLLDVSMDVTACHMNGCPLRLDDLLAASNLNFAHDVGGICWHLDRETGKLQDSFCPRFAA